MDSIGKIHKMTKKAEGLTGLDRVFVLIEVLKALNSDKMACPFCQTVQLDCNACNNTGIFKITEAYK